MFKSSENELVIQTELAAKTAKLEKVQKENADLRRLLKEFQEKLGENEEDPGAMSLSQMMEGPSLEYELARRKVSRDIREMWWFVKGTLESLISQDKVNEEVQAQMASFIEDVQHHEKVVLADLAEMRAHDGHDTWREEEAKALSDLVQARLHAVQNPEDCKNAKKLVCNLNKGCGYGCQIHHAIYCFIVSYGTERMLVLKSKGWRYNKNGFEDFFLPVSDKCPVPSKLENKKTWGPNIQDTINVELGIVDSVNPRPAFLPPAIPSDLSDRIQRLHGDPIVWWVSQFLKYLLRPQAELTKMLQDSETRIKFEHPIVGIHVRRTDKVGTEAAFHSIDEYMKHVVEYYQEREVKQGHPDPVKRVFVASDDVKVLAECVKKYPDFEFLGDTSIAKSAAVPSRYTSSSLKGVITDIHLLSLTDYLVCTFSSQVCRIAYEIMQEFHVDAYDRFKSLDDIWYFGGQDEHQQVAVLPHNPKSRKELPLEVGDVLGVAGNHWNGFNKGKNHRNNLVGLYPEYKTREKLKIVDFPTYPNVKL